MESNKIDRPQLENGFIQIATGKEENDVLMALIKASLTTTEYQVIFLVIRKTWGFKKKEDWISLTQFEQYLGKNRGTVCSAIKSLVLKNILVRKSIQGVSATYQPNKEFNKWNILVRKPALVRNTKRTSTKNRTQLVSQTIPTKQTLTKETSTKEKINSMIPFFNDVNPSYERLYAIPAQRAALSRLVDKYGPKWVAGIIKRLPEITSRPYAPRITTPYELEMKLGQLKVFLQQEKQKATKVGSVKV